MADDGTNPAEHVPPPVADLNWSISGTGDCADDKTDILWRNSATGVNRVWMMDGTNPGCTTTPDQLEHQRYRRL